MWDLKSQDNEYYTGVTGRPVLLRMIEHTSRHRKCILIKNTETGSKRLCLATEVMNISLLDTLHTFGLIKGVLNDSGGGDGKTASENYDSERYSIYCYYRNTTFGASSTESGLLKKQRAFKEMPETYSASGKRVCYGFCSVCYSWVAPYKREAHMQLHFRKNLRCPHCERTFATEQALIVAHQRRAHAGEMPSHTSFKVSKRANECKLLPQLPSEGRRISQHLRIE